MPKFLPRTLPQILIGLFALIVFVLIWGLNENAGRYQQILSIQSTLEVEIEQEKAESAALEATLEYWRSNNAVRDYVRDEKRRQLADEVPIKPAFTISTPVPEPPASPETAERDPANYVEPWQMWWYLLTDAPPPK